jgi:hypothetical protein
MPLADISLNEFPGLKLAARSFNPFYIRAWMRDPGWGYEHVYLLLIEFNEDRRYGLCIWNNRDKEFIEEPGDLDAYGFSGLTALYKKYPSLKNFKYYANKSD